MRILVVHQFYLLPGCSGGSRFNEMARLWADAGHDVTVIAGTVEYTTGQVPKRYRRRWLTREQDGAVTVWRCHTPPSYGRGYLGRMLAFAGFTLSAATAALRVEEPDIVIASSPPLIAALPGWIAARCRRQPVPWIFEIRDLWPESAVTTGVLRADSCLTRWLYQLERWACRRANRISVLTPAFSDDLVTRGLASSSKVAFIPNGADLDRFRPESRDNGIRRQFGWGDKLVALYAGAHGRANALRQLIDAAEHLRERSDILIAAVGDGPERSALEAETRRRGLGNIRFYGAQPKERMPEWINACDIGLAVLQDNPTFRTVYPNKIFDYMACERPMILAIDGVARNLVCEEAAAGVFAAPENGASLAAAITGLAGDPEQRARLGRHGRSWVVANASREALAERYLNLMRETECCPELVLRSRQPSIRHWRTGWKKRLLDWIGSLALLILTAPLMGMVAFAILIRMGRPVLFRQTRIGLGERPFTLYKFRTMTGDGQEGVQSDVIRLTPLGRWLRRTSLDELPQLWNVLRGEMSLVGPRPLLPQYLPRYNAVERQRHQVLPGITGWAQIHGRNATGWEERFALDVWYSLNHSFFLDLTILVKTAVAVLSHRGISQPGEATMREFQGHSEQSAV